MGPGKKCAWQGPKASSLSFHTEQLHQFLPPSEGEKNGFYRARVENKGKETTYLHIPNQANA